MKWLATLILGFGSVAQAASADLQPALEKLERVYAEVTDADLVDYNYFLNFNREAPTVKAMLADSEGCESRDQFEKIAPEELVALIKDELGEGIRRVSEGTDSYPEQMIALNEATESLAAALESRTVRICTVTLYPSYSDGHEMKFVKISGRLTFVFEVGSPD